MTADKEKFRVLSLDGGGTRGYLSALILANLEQYLNDLDKSQIPLGQRFDFIVGTSTGGLIALALASGKFASSLVSYYVEHVPIIFRRTRLSKWRKLLRPQYSSVVLRESLGTILDSTHTLADLSVDVCITAVALQEGKARLYKTDYLHRNKNRLDEKLVDIALATTAAPTFFSAHSLKYSKNLVDGGLCANNPSVIGIVDACQFERPSKRGTNQVCGELKDIVLVSVGTGEQPKMPYDVDNLKDGGEWDWVRAAFALSLESQSQLAHFQAAFLIRDRYLRINPTLKSPMELDDSNLGKLENLADITAIQEPFLRRFF